MYRSVFIRHAELFSRNCTGPVTNIVDFVPLLQLIQTTIQRRVKKLHKDVVETYGRLISGIKQRLDGGATVEDCVVKSILQDAGEEDRDDLDMSVLATAFMVGGAETVRQLWCSQSSHAKTLSSDGCY